MRCVFRILSDTGALYLQAGFFREAITCCTSKTRKLLPMLMVVGTHANAILILIMHGIFTTMTKLRNNNDDCYCKGGSWLWQANHNHEKTFQHDGENISTATARFTAPPAPPPVPAPPRQPPPPAPPPRRPPPSSVPPPTPPPPTTPTHHQQHHQYRPCQCCAIISIMLPRPGPRHAKITTTQICNNERAC